MDSAHSQLEQQLQQIKKAKITAESDVDQTRRKQNEQDWLEEDSNQLTQEKRVLLDFYAVAGKAKKPVVFIVI